ncbi:hypothetical protein M0R45_005880 [Rubus argutus]|uniref:Uncharacterized protein n=1 Tax=Rubus argutus TaxID=59490 RepID=A0AAW1YNV9_RUBAR
MNTAKLPANMTPVKSGSRFALLQTFSEGFDDALREEPPTPIEELGKKYYTAEPKIATLWKKVQAKAKGIAGASSSGGIPCAPVSKTTPKSLKPLKDITNGKLDLSKSTKSHSNDPKQTTRTHSISQSRKKHSEAHDPTAITPFPNLESLISGIRHHHFTAIAALLFCPHHCHRRRAQIRQSPSSQAAASQHNPCPIYCTTRAQPTHFIQSLSLSACRASAQSTAITSCQQLHRHRIHNQVPICNQSQQHPAGVSFNSTPPLQVIAAPGFRLTQNPCSDAAAQTHQAAAPSPSCCRPFLSSTACSSPSFDPMLSIHSLALSPIKLDSYSNNTQLPL